MAKKDMTRAYKVRNQLQRERVTVSKRLANQCVKAVRSKIVSSQRTLKEAHSRAKRLSKEMQKYWRQYDMIASKQRKQQVSS